MKKAANIIVIIAFLASACNISYAAETGPGFFAPCQYKQVYRYYMDKAQAHLDDNQPQAALDAYKMALMVQPISEEAKGKIARLERLLKQGKAPAADSTREKIMSDTLKQVEQVKRSFKKIETNDNFSRRLVQYREMNKIETVKQPKKVNLDIPAARKPQLIQKSQPVQKIQPLQKPSGPQADNNTVYTGNFPLERFSNGIDESIQTGVKIINDNVAPGKISGDYRIAFGFTSDDVIWKDANADHIGVPGEKNWRYLFGENTYNTYDKQIYDRLRVEAEGPITQNTSGYTEIVIDPWTYVGRKDITVTGSGGSSVNMRLKYWSNASRTINETYRAENGDIVNVQENKVVEGETTPASYFGLTDWGSNKFSVGKESIDRMEVPIRKLWIDYTNGPYRVKLFPMASQDEALTSDDPLKLSNNKAWWEESPWLDEYEASKIFTRADNPVKGGNWVRRMSFVAKNSDYERLTFLRGISIASDYDNGFSFSSTFAAPRNLWDYYEEVSSVPGAIRIKLPQMDKLNVGALYTTKLGIFKQELQASNQLAGVDGAYQLSPDTSIYAQCAGSFTKIDEANDYNNEYWGMGSILGIKNKGIINSLNSDYEVNLNVSHFNDNFLPGLSNYRFSRKDSIYAKHVYFEQLRPENEAEMIGNGIDIDRIAFNINAKADFLNSDLKTRIDIRDVRTDSSDFIEDVVRAEAEYKVNPKLTAKGLLRYEYLPKTEKGIDPLINAKTSYIAFTDYFSDKDVWLENTAIEEGKDPSIGTYSIGFKYDALKNLSFQAIYELTNDPLDMPRGLLNNVYVTQETRDGVMWDKIVPFLYNQSSFGLPPYDYYNIYKLRLTYYPIDKLKIEPSFVYNENEFATTIDDNVNHAGCFIEYKPTDKLTVGGAYYFIKTRDLWKDTIGGGGKNFEGHHNIFLEADYSINPNQVFSLMFGEYTGYGCKYYEEYTSIGPLDTQHIVRLVYKGKF
ncbi:MAG: hypothetical protein JW946_01770 [Candidatus Omnitrophica bacterium]|nr:hypothetical protein [Candidatus Omnitrophota bacterium]